MRINVFAELKPGMQMLFEKTIKYGKFCNSSIQNLKILITYNIKF